MTVILIQARHLTCIMTLILIPTGGLSQSANGPPWLVEIMSHGHRQRFHHYACYGKDILSFLETFHHIPQDK